MITGIRGSGKTVFLTSLSDHFKADKNWVCVELGTQRDMLSGLAAKLASQDTLAAIFRSAKINLSLFGFGLEVSGTAPIADVESALEKMLASMARHGKKLLICVDEVVTSDYLRAFCSAFQIFVREKLPVFLLMTGLYENIETLRNTPNLTFLYRATRVSMDPLSRFSIADSYQRMFSLSRESALEMASMPMPISIWQSTHISKSGPISRPATVTLQRPSLVPRTTKTRRFASCSAGRQTSTTPTACV